MAVDDHDGAAGTSALAGRGILIVEDEFLVALDLKSLLEGMGCAVIGSVGTLEEALACLERAPPDAVLLDVQLAAGDTAPLARLLRERGVPFLVMTGYDRAHLVEPALRDAPLLGKPLDEALLRQMLLGLLGAA
jgi:CheY-like chemotaxis protein